MMRMGTPDSSGGALSALRFAFLCGARIPAKLLRPRQWRPNRRYWAELAKATVRTPIRPQHFVLVDRFIGGDDDRLDWQEGITNLARLSVTALLLPAGKTQRELLAETGGLKTAWAVYSPPGDAFAPQNST